MRARVAFQTAFLLAVVAITAMSGLRGSADAPLPEAARSSHSSGGAAAEPMLFAPGELTTGDHETHLELSADGKTAYFLKNAPDFGFWTIYVSHLRNDHWSPPEVAPFSGRFVDADPHITPDGRLLLFISNRPADPKSDERSDNFDIWAMDKLPSGAWDEPRRLDAPVNSPGSEFYPRMAADGTLYFGSERPGGRGGADLWRCRQVNGAFQPAENLGDAINSTAAEFEPYITPDQQTLIFMASGRDGNQSSDLFISTMRDGAWTPARSLGAPINSPRGREYAPKISPDGKWFFFSSTRSTWDRPNRTPMTTRDYEQRIHAPGNGLGDMYYIDVRALPQS